MLSFQRFFIFMVLAFAFVFPHEALSQYGAAAPLPGGVEQADRPLAEAGSVQKVIVSEIVLEGNNITRESLILREMVFARGDSLTLNALHRAMQESRENLLNTAFFNFVEMSLSTDDFPLVKVNILFVERWYIWPFPIIEIGDRNINEWLANPSASRLNYGFYLVWDNFRGGGDRVELLLKSGYKQLYTLRYAKPYFDRAKTLGWSMETGLSQTREIAYTTMGNRQQFVETPDAFIYRNYFFNASLNYRPGMRNFHSFRLGFEHFAFGDTLLALNPFYSPDGRTRLNFLSAHWDFKHDYRDLKAYPLKGHYFDVRLSRFGLGLLPDENMSLTTIESSFRKYFELASRWHFATGLNAKLSHGRDDVYFRQQGLGFKGDLVRGYENYVIDGQHFLVFKSNLKYSLIPQRSRRLNFLPGERFGLIHYALYLNLFADAGYIDDKYFQAGNQLNNTLLTGFGLGLDFVTYYDRVLRTELSINGRGEAGLFFHLIAPI